MNKLFPSDISNRALFHPSGLKKYFAVGSSQVTWYHCGMAPARPE